MNYRHAFHAGNFADVFKHAVLTRIVLYLQRKDKAFRVLDTHAGPGLYDLGSNEAERTGEWRGGIGRLMEAHLPDAAAALLDPYLAAVRAENPEGGLRRYPGSPLLVRHLLRKQDRLSAMELRPDDAARLKRLFAGDVQVRAILLDGWLALNAHLPPKEKRGMVLVDPPFEEPGEWERLVEGLGQAHRRWPGGTVALWYPLKDRDAVRAFRAALAASGVPDLVDIRFSVRAPSPAPRLDGCGMVVANPPFALTPELKAILPALRDALKEDAGAAWGIERLTPERPAGAKRA